MEQPKISIVVPVYNAEKYLSRCLDSLLCQTYHNFEIICVNDGSTDESLNILNEYAKKDKRIKVFSQENGGASVARNNGIKNCTGDYVGFIDADDWVLLTLFQTFVDNLQNITKPLDIWMFNVGSYIKGNNDVRYRVFFDATDWKLHPSDDYEHGLHDYMRPFSRNLSAANKFFNLNFLRANDIYFPEHLKYEDQYFWIKALLHSRSLKFTEDVFYRYRNNLEDSTSVQITERAFEIFQIMDLIEEEIHKVKEEEFLKYAFFQYKFICYTFHFKYCPENLYDKYYEEVKRRLKEGYTADLDPNLATHLRHFNIYEDYMVMSSKEFIAKYKNSPFW